jgi:hypothetical protein
MASPSLALELGQGWRASATAPRRPARAVLEEAEEAGMLGGAFKPPYFCTGLTPAAFPFTAAPAASAASSARSSSTNSGSHTFRPGFIRSAR